MMKLVVHGIVFKLMPPLKRYLLEESFELFEAIDNEDDWHMIEELGDILLQVLLHASIGKKKAIWTFKKSLKA